MRTESTELDYLLDKRGGCEYKSKPSILSDRKEDASNNKHLANKIFLTEISKVFLLINQFLSYLLSFNLLF